MAITGLGQKRGEAAADVARQRCDRCVYERDCSPLPFDGEEWMLCDDCIDVVRRRKTRRRLNHD